MIRNLQSGVKLLLRLLRETAAAAQRPAYLRHAAACLAASFAFLLAPSLALAVYFAPALLLAIRYHELAQQRAVRTSTWLLGLTTVCSAASAYWAIEHHGGALELILYLALASALLAEGCHLWSSQRHHQRSSRRRARTRVYDDQPRWACGGLLAALPVLFLLGLYGALLSWRSPLVLAWGFCAVPLLVLQLRTHPLFPKLAIAWLVAFLVIEVACTLPNGASEGDDLFLAATLVLLTAPVGLYLAFHPRVRRTFRAAHAPPIADEDPDAVPATTETTRRREKGAPA